MTEKWVSADWREEFINQIKELSGPNAREQLMAVNVKVIAFAMRGDLTQDDAEIVSAEIDARLQRHHDAKARAKAEAEAAYDREHRLGSNATAALLKHTPEGMMAPAKTKACSDHQPLPPEELLRRRARRDKHDRDSKLARWPAEFWFFKPAQGAVACIIVRDLIRFGSCTRSYESLMKAAGVCRAVVAETIDIIRRRGLLSITRRRRNSNLITTLPGKIHDYIFKSKNKNQILEEKEKRDPLYSLVQQTLEISDPIEAPPVAFQAPPVGTEPKWAEAAPEPTSAQETAKTAQPPARPAVEHAERPVATIFDGFLDAILRRNRLDPRRREGGVVPEPG